MIRRAELGLFSSAWVTGTSRCGTSCVSAMATTPNVQCQQADGRCAVHHPRMSEGAVQPYFDGIFAE
jgi:hypothetical protein